MEKFSEVISSERLLSDQEIDRILNQEIYPEHIGDVMRPRNHQSELIYIAGQPGSGKSRYEKVITEGLNLQEPNTTIAINCDDMRDYHPRFADLQAEDDISAAIKINPDNARFTDSLIDRSIEVGCNVVLEGTFRNPDSVAKTAAKYIESGYETSAIVIATHPLISRLGIIDRYLEEKELRGVGRFTYRDVHDQTISAIPKTIHKFIDNQLGSKLALISRAGEILYNTDTRGMSRSEITRTASKAREIISAYYDRDLDDPERHFASTCLNRNINRALKLDAPAVIIDELLGIYQMLDQR